MLRAGSHGGSRLPEKESGKIPKMCNPMAHAAMVSIEEIYNKLLLALLLVERAVRLFQQAGH